MTTLIRQTHHPVYSSEGELADGTAPSGSWSVVGRNAAGQLLVLANRYNEQDARELLGHRSLRMFNDQEVVANGRGRDGSNNQRDQREPAALRASWC